MGKKKELIASCTNGISEDINGQHYQLYDAEKLYDAVVQKAFKWLAKKGHRYSYGLRLGNVNTRLKDDFLEAMNK